jgi:hypothetical protein
MNRMGTCKRVRKGNESAKTQGDAAHTRQAKMELSGSNPNGVVQQSPGLAPRRPWVIGRRCPSTPTGLRPSGRKTGRLASPPATTPLGLRRPPSPLPRVVLSVQPWASLSNRVAVETTHASSGRKSGKLSPRVWHRHSIPVWLERDLIGWRCYEHGAPNGAIAHVPRHGHGISEPGFLARQRRAGISAQGSTLGNRGVTGACPVRAGVVIETSGILESSAIPAFRPRVPHYGGQVGFRISDFGFRISRFGLPPST